MFKAYTLIPAAALVFSLPAFAGTEKGDLELQIQGTLSNTTNSENDNEDYNLVSQFTMSYFLTDNLALGASLSVSSNYSQDEDGNGGTRESTSTYSFLNGRLDYVFGSSESKVSPYVGTHLGVVGYYYDSGDTDYSDSSYNYGLHGGVKIFAGENTSWNIEGDWTNYELDSITYTSLRVLAGFSYYY